MALDAAPVCESVFASSGHGLSHETNSASISARLACAQTEQCRLSCAYSDALDLIVAGDAGGHVHFLRLEEPKHNF